MEIMYLSLHCHHQNDSCIKMGSNDSHFDVSLIARRLCPLTTAFLKKKESQSRIKLRPFCLNWLTSPLVVHHLWYLVITAGKGQGCGWVYGNWFKEKNSEMNWGGGGGGGRLGPATYEIKIKNCNIRKPRADAFQASLSPHKLPLPAQLVFFFCKVNLHHTVWGCAAAYYFFIN